MSQEITGSIVGTITDATGAGVVGASVKVINTGQGLVMRTVTTNETGGYVATFLPIGQYEVRVESKGFKTFVNKNITLNVNDKLTVNAKLEVGTVEQSVTVEEAPVQVELQSAASGTLINGTQVRELQLSNRNFMQLMQLMPGVATNTDVDTFFIGTSAPGGSTNTIPFAVNGGRTSQNNWTVDGADIVDRGSNLTLLNYPSVDAIAEFRVLRGQYSAEFGRAATGQVNVVTRSGNNKFHGTAYEFFRNDKLNANNFLNNRVNIARPPLRYNNWGYSFSGPVIIPGLYKPSQPKLFFFWSHEFRSQILYSNRQPLLPTTNQVAGNFAMPVCVEFTATGTCARTGTQVTNVSPTARAYLNNVFGKLPLSANANLVDVLFRTQYGYRQELAKVDYVFSERLQASFRFINDTIPTIDPGGLFTGSSVPNYAVTDTNQPGRGTVLRVTQSISPTTFNEFGYAWSWGGIFATNTGLNSTVNSPDIKPRLVFPSTVARVPSITFASGFTSLGGFGPYDNKSQNHNIFDNVTFVRGRHTIKTGFSINFYQKRENQVSNNAGTFTFQATGAPTAVAGGPTQATINNNQVWANFLLGRAASFTQAQLDLFPDIRAQQYEGYVQDDFRVRRNLTINIGVRYGLYRAPTEQDNVLTNFSEAAYGPAQAPQINPVSGNIIRGTGSLQNGIIIAGRNSPFGNRIGATDKTNWAPRIGIVWDPFGRGKTAIRSGYGLAYDVPLVGILQQNVGTNPPFADTVTVNNTSLDDANVGVGPAELPVRSLRGTPVNFRSPYVQQWSLDVQHEIAKGLVASVGYYGSKGVKLIGVVDINSFPPGFVYTTGVLPAGTTAITATTSPRLNAIRRFRGYGAVNTIQNWFGSNYHSLQATVNKRFRGRSTLAFNYTWSRALTDSPTDRNTGTTDITNRRLEYGPATFNRTHVATFNYVYDLPFFAQSKGFTHAALGGWQLSGIVTMQSGRNLTVFAPTNRDPAGIGVLGNAGINTPRPDLLSDPNNGPGALKTFLQFFDPAAFADVPAGQSRLGNAGRGVVIGPGSWVVNFSLFKNFKLWPEKGLTSQFRAEAFNALNHTNFSGVATTFGNTDFGRVNAVRDPRNIQLALKFNF